MFLSFDIGTSTRIETFRLDAARRNLHRERRPLAPPRPL
jgi:hypothetical protein